MMGFRCTTSDSYVGTYLPRSQDDWRWRFAGGCPLGTGVCNRVVNERREDTPRAGRSAGLPRLVMMKKTKIGVFRSLSERLRVAQRLTSGS